MPTSLLSDHASRVIAGTSPIRRPTGRPVITIGSTLIDSNGGASVTIDAPDNVASGDLVGIMATLTYVDGGSPPSAPSVTGFTLVASVLAVGPEAGERYEVHYLERSSPGGEPASYTLNTSAANIYTDAVAWKVQNHAGRVATATGSAAVGTGSRAFPTLAAPEGALTVVCQSNYDRGNTAAAIGYEVVVAWDDIIGGGNVSYLHQRVSHVAETTPASTVTPTASDPSAFIAICYASPA